jgi:hypothetical protein
MGRGEYALLGVCLFAFKYNLDRVIAEHFFGVSWYPWSYFFGEQNWAELKPELSLTLLAVSLPFVWIGLASTIRRLADAGWTPWLSLLFFVPIVNVVLIAILCAQPSKDPMLMNPGWLNRFSTESRLVAAAFGILCASILGTAATVMSVQYFKTYAWGVFVGIPFVTGLSAALLLCIRKRQPLLNCILAAGLSILLLAGLLLAIAIEGIICIAMAVPIAMPLAVLGAVVAWLMCGKGYFSSQTYCCGWGAVLALLWLEGHAPSSVPLHAVTTVCEIDAAPSEVWKNVIAFADLPPPTEDVFLAGIAYPVRARLEGRGVGAVRHCEFSTGSFVEPITRWEENERLSFDVISQPPPMREWSPYGAIKPAHLEDFFLSQRGDFRLVDLGNGRTRLEGTTWYTQRIEPQRYWRFWSDFLVHTIHRRVLMHIKHQAENPAP